LCFINVDNFFNCVCVPFQWNNTNNQKNNKNMIKIDDTHQRFFFCQMRCVFYCQHVNKINTFQNKHNNKSTFLSFFFLVLLIWPFGKLNSLLSCGICHFVLFQSFDLSVVRIFIFFHHLWNLLFCGIWYV
jgi:hypothetical protein